MCVLVDHLSFSYNRPACSEDMVLKDVSFSLEPGMCLGILGRTGSGKTTLLKLLAGLLTPSRGRVSGVREDAVFRPGLVFQLPERLFFETVVYDDLVFALRTRGLANEEIEERAARVCAQTGIDLDDIRDRNAAVLPRGLSRRLAIACVLINDPEPLILDEPGVGLDPHSLGDLVEILGGLKRAGGTLVIVSHDMDPFLELTDRILLIHDQRMAAFGAPADVFDTASRDQSLQDMIPPLAETLRRVRAEGAPLPRDEFRAAAAARIVRESGRRGNNP